tara:strand:- start:9877 stop:10182 length:306 start_codon:yes stop_codon:yes gene_type:complete
MNELLITIMLVIPPASKGIHWTTNKIPNQLQVTFKSGVEASYLAIQVPCHTKPTKPGWVVYHGKSMGQEVCYLADTNYPVMVRGPWETTITKTYKHKEKQK